MKAFVHTYLAVAFIFACSVMAMSQAETSAATEIVAAPEGKATIYIYRIKQYAGSALEPSVYVDDKELARMDNGRYFGVTLEPGLHTFRMGDKQTGFEVNMKPGQVYYAKVTIEMGFWKGHGRLTYLQPEQGAFELKKVKPLSAGKVRNRDLVTIFENNTTQPAVAPVEKAGSTEKAGN